MCPYMTGGRSRRGSPKAGTTVYQTASVIVKWNDKEIMHLFIFPIMLSVNLLAIMRRIYFSVVL